MNQNLRISKLKLNNYRNHKYVKIVPEKNIILISGKNGSGKTNILESISLFDSNSGFRNAGLSELINYEMNGPLELFGVNLCLLKGPIKNELGVGITSRENILKKIVSINKQKKKSIKDLMNVFWMLPEMAHLFQGSPELRRSFLDSMISTTNKLHKKKLTEYKKFKNERLKILKSSESTNGNWLDVVEKKMSETGIIICDSRRTFLNNLNDSFSEIDDQIPSLSFKLNGVIDILLNEKPALYVEELLCEKLRENRLRDTISGRTNFTVNKTDLLIFGRNSNKEAKNFSTGEQKIIIISIIFAFLKILESVKNSNVLFLLDDIFSYLDYRFIERIVTKLSELKLQTWITDVQLNRSSKLKHFDSIIHNINIDDYRFKVLNN